MSRNIRCVYCGQLIRMDEMEEHFLQCEERDQAYAQHAGRPGDEVQEEEEVEGQLKLPWWME